MERGGAHGIPGINGGAPVEASFRQLNIAGL
jgi:hypothetical protein